MRYQINDFVFDATNLVLTKNGDNQEIRHNEAKVLALLLSQQYNVLSKETILAEVWREKVVSEQAVFQNISHLRSVFGNSAIKTFPKRGYQWQLETTIITESIDDAVTPEQNTHQTNKQTNDLQDYLPNAQPIIKENEQPSASQRSNNIVKANNNPRLQKPLYIGIATMFCMLVLSFFLLDFSEQAPHQSVAFKTDNDALSGKEDILTIGYLPLPSVNETNPIEGIDKASEDAYLPVLQDNATINFVEVTGLSTSSFLASAELEYPKLAKDFPFILATEVRTHGQQYFVDFQLKGPHNTWQGQTSGKTYQEAIDKLTTHIQRPVVNTLISSALPPQVRLANLSIAHEEQASDLIVLTELIQSYIKTNDLDKAMVLAEKMETLALANNDTFYAGQALLKQSQILTSKNLIELSANKLVSALRYFEQMGDLKRQSDVWNAQSWLDHQHKDYPALKQSLLKAASLALEANDIGRELGALTYLSVMAHKHRQQHDQYLYLQQAEQKMNAYQLPQYHYAKVPFHYAIFTKHIADKEPHLKQVLVYTELTPDHWVAQSSRKQLIEYYVSENRLDEAQTLVQTLTSDNAQNSYLKTLFAQATGNMDDYTEHAQRAFEQAQLSGNQWLSLDIALLMLESKSDKVNVDFYSQFIENNAIDRWRKINEVKLLALNE
ncbi:transcriptional regulator [Thalassotalea euphylliae]|uniref:winged helix-turn-helix domain-containing protein n=1 Tax=Thalassotalea euphylliae TaxID=1655234 RepID=UPI0036396E8D